MSTPLTRVTSAVFAGLIPSLLLLLSACSEIAQLPRIDQIVPDQAQVGQSVDIIGAGFEANENRFITIAKQQVPAQHWSPSRIRVAIPQLPPGSVLVVVTVDYHPSNAAELLVLEDN